MLHRGLHLLIGPRLHVRVVADRRRLGQQLRKHLSIGRHHIIIPPMIPPAMFAERPPLVGAGTVLCLAAEQSMRCNSICSRCCASCCALHAAGRRGEQHREASEPGSWHSSLTPLRRRAGRASSREVLRSIGLAELAPVEDLPAPSRPASISASCCCAFFSPAIADRLISASCCCANSPLQPSLARSSSSSSRDVKPSPIRLERSCLTDNARACQVRVPRSR